ncbi:MAG TPA: response regulator [Chitinophagaceae bacterium]
MEQVICIIEDDESIQDVLSIILKRAGYKIEMYSDGTAFFQRDCTLPDLFLIDKQLPGIDGLTICKHLKENSPTSMIPVVMMSAFPGAKELSLSAGADNFIEKPFQLDKLLSTIKHYTFKSVA